MVTKYPRVAATSHRYSFLLPSLFHPRHFKRTDFIISPADRSKEMALRLRAREYEGEKKHIHDLSMFEYFNEDTISTASSSLYI